MSSTPVVKLNSGYNFPLIGLGTFGGHNAPTEVYKAVKVALEEGYRHIDTAYICELKLHLQRIKTRLFALDNTEQAVGTAIKESNIKRQDLFITTKLWGNFHEPQHVGPVFERSLKNLKLDYVDLYLIHWPMSWKFDGYELCEWESKKSKPVTHVPIIDTWRAMENLVKEGKARSIGVSNFTIPMLEDLLSKCEIPPATNQNIVLTGYSPLGNPGYMPGAVKTLDEPVVLDMSKKYGKTPVQVLLNWGINRGYCVIPKSITPSRIRDNLTFFQMEDKDIEAITALGREKPIRTWKPEECFGPENVIFD
ncbi:NADP-dependent oxidoreductase domain-containing protein [Mucor lusitanicus]